MGISEQAGSFLKKRTKKLLSSCAQPGWMDRSQCDQKFFASFFQKRRPFLAACTALGVGAALSGCGPAYDPLTREGLWRPVHANRADLVMQVANPSDLTFGKGTSGSDGQLDAAAVERLRAGKLKKLLDSGLAQISVTSGSGSDNGAATNSSQ
jgi:hypothetical protein